MTDEDADFVTFAVQLRHSRCGGTVLVSLTDPDMDLDGYRVACPHCPEVAKVGDAYEVLAFADLAVHPDDLEAVDDLDDHPQADVLGASQARDFLHVAIQGTPAVDWADQRDVNPPTVRGAVSRARRAIRNATTGGDGDG